MIDACKPRTAKGDKKDGTVYAMVQCQLRPLLHLKSAELVDDCFFLVLQSKKIWSSLRHQFIFVFFSVSDLVRAFPARANGS